MKANTLELKERILHIEGEGFEALALDVFRLQAKHCSVYRDYLSFLKVKPENVRRLEDIRFLPVSVFKYNDVLSVPRKADETLFLSSGTTLQNRSKHWVQDLDFYKEVSKLGFEQQIGKLSQFRIIAVLPSYQQQGNSSLIKMMEFFINDSAEGSGFYSFDFEQVINLLQEKSDAPTLLFGVSYALLDLAEKIISEGIAINSSNLMVMETGGMKGRREEMHRNELHYQLCIAFKVPTIGSEYGMTELLSQAYSTGDGIFYPTPTMRVVGRNQNDPFQVNEIGKRSRLCIIDLANIDSCSFIETQDLGSIFTDGSFAIFGRTNDADLRGCNLMYDFNQD